ncbi:MAG TPA: hypothetical protein GX706_02725 [Candidatus Moranbacteria bacterium]|nr:hypothetical protein [Candidatus Moranbacteria bacterium]
MAFTLEIIIEHPRVELVLRENEELTGRVSWDDQNNISNKLLVEIDKLLKKNNLKVQDLKKVFTSSNQKSYTASRIARVTAKTINFCLTEK